jgi:hypothetical protein
MAFGLRLQVDTPVDREFEFRVRLFEHLDRLAVIHITNSEPTITPGYTQAIARVFTTFVQTIEISDFDQRLQVLETRQAEDRPTQPRPWQLSSLAT